MSHFLARLIDRVQERAPLAEPLIPPSYATSAWAGYEASPQPEAPPASAETAARRETPAAPMGSQPAGALGLQAESSYEGPAQPKAPSMTTGTTVPTEEPAAPLGSQPARSTGLRLEPKDTRAEPVRPLPFESLVDAATPPSMDAPPAPAVSRDDGSSTRGEGTVRRSVGAIAQQDMQLGLEARHLVPPVPRKPKADDRQARGKTNTGAVSLTPEDRLIPRPVESEQSLTLQYSTTNTSEPASPSTRATARQSPGEALKPEVRATKSDGQVPKDRPAPHLDQRRPGATLIRPLVRQATTMPEARAEAGLESPTINVTIGRIEVRAVTPPTPPPKRSSPPAPTLSLNDYLKRQGGKR
jgi:hypothetical protein